MIEFLPRAAAHLVFRGRRFHYHHLSAAARDIRGQAILEIGSGRAVRGKHRYSARHLFDASNTFVQSDIVSAYGHRVVDVTELATSQEYDVILCLNVLEHVYQFQRALENLHRALRPGGQLFLGVPAYYPLHDEPADYWRFTEHSLRRLLEPYATVEILHSGFRRYPFAYHVRARKGETRHTD